MRIPGICLLLAVFAGPALAQSPGDYAGRWPLQLPAGAAAGVFEPGPEVYGLLQDPAFGDLQVFDATGAPMPMARAAGGGAPRRVAADFASAGPADGAAGDAGVMAYAYRLRADVPVSAARVEFGSTPSNVALQFEAGGRWQTAARVPVPRARADQPGAAPVPPGEVSFQAPVTAHAWRIISGRALSPSPGLQLSIAPARFVFLAQGVPPYLLAAGHPALRRPAATIDAELGRLRTTRGASWAPAPATVGARAATPFVAAVAPAEATIDWRRWLTWVAAGLGVLIVSWLLLRRRRSTRSR